MWLKTKIQFQQLWDQQYRLAWFKRRLLRKKSTRKEQSKGGWEGAEFAFVQDVKKQRCEEQSNKTVIRDTKVLHVHEMIILRSFITIIYINGN